jgi:hypothetical protein
MVSAYGGGVSIAVRVNLANRAFDTEKVGNPKPVAFPDPWQASIERDGIRWLN